MYNKTIDIPMASRIKSKDVFAILLLLILAAFYCHRFYGGHFSLEGDSLFWVFLRLHPDLIHADHNPYQFGYFSLWNWRGPGNPVPEFFSWLVSSLTSLDAAAKAVLACLLTSVSMTFLLASSIYLFLRSQNRSFLAALLGSLIVSFTGFHLIGIWEFNSLYQQSFLFVCPLLFCFLQLLESKNRLLWSTLAGIAIGFSLLSGTNVPLFYYLPLTFLLPFIPKELALKDRVKIAGWMLASALLGLAIAAPTLLPGINSLLDSNRRLEDFSNSSFAISFQTRLLNTFFRDWWLPPQGNFHEQDSFLGLPVIALFLIGLTSAIKKEGRQVPITCLMLLFLFWSLVMMNFSFFPAPLTKPLRFFFNGLAFRNPNRFFLLALLPISYFASSALDTLLKKKSLLLVLGLGALQGFLYFHSLVPSIGFQIPDLHMAATWSLSFGLLALIALVLRAPLLVCVGIFFQFFFAPIQFTHYAFQLAQEPKLLRLASSDRLGLPSFLGLQSHYGELFQQARDYLIKPPPYLASRESLQGRIWDQNPTGFQRLGHFDLFASETHHHFFFSIPDHHMSSRHLLDLYHIQSEKLLDLANVCWLIPRSQETLVQRSSCFPEQFLVGQITKQKNDTETLRWLEQSQRNTLRNTVSITCQGAECSQLTSDSAPFNGTVQVIRETPGHLEYMTDAAHRGYLFLSTLFNPEWVSRVNGESTKIFRADHAFMAIPVPAGRSHIVFEMTHATEKVSGWIMSLSLSVSILVLLAFVLKLQPKDWSL